MGILGKAFEEYSEESMWIPDDHGHYEFTWYDFGEKRKMPFSHRLRIAYRLLVRGRIDFGDRSRRADEKA